MGVYLGVGGQLLDLATGIYSGAFVPGVTEPFYTIASDFSGARNVGTAPGVTLTTYGGTITGGVATLSGSTVHENVLFPCVLDITGPVTLRNCRIVVPSSYTTTADSIKACVRVLNGGAGNSGARFENVEIHNRAQRPLNGITGRNFYLDRSVITGCVDGVSDSTAGSAPQNFAYVVTDSVIPALAFWYSDPSNSDIHNPDKGSHSDCFQKYTTLQGTVTNTVILSHVDELIGTGTPGSGRDAGNPYAPGSGTDYTASQSQMETWRAAKTGMSVASQTYGGISKRVFTGTDGSFAAVMVNVDKLDLNKCVLDGGTVTINASSTALATTVDMSVTDCTFYNSMVNGHGSDPTAKGHAALMRTGKDFDVFTGNKWFDGPNVTVVKF